MRAFIRKAKPLSILLIPLLASFPSFAQIRIDKQQCFGGYDEDLIRGRGIIMEDDFILLAGTSLKPGSGTGMVPEYCSDVLGNDHTWVVKVNYDYEVIDSWCYELGIQDILKVENSTKNEYYLVGGGFCDICGDVARNMKVIKINSDGEEIWSSCFGNLYGYYYEPGGGELTYDGGVLAFANYTFGGCDISHHYGGLDGWMVAMDSLGNMTWETTLGTGGNDILDRVDRSNRGGFYTTMFNYPAGSYGNLAQCFDPPMYGNATLIKMDSVGGIEWQECYGCNPGPSIQAGMWSFTDLEDGFIGIGTANCNNGDLEGSGWHEGWHNNIPSTDIWLLRLDLDRNVVWSRCYGGSSDEGVTKVFPMEDGGFMAFGVTLSNNGDVASAAHIGLMNPCVGVGWVFRTDANGNLLWERCLGSDGGNGCTAFMDVVKHNDREYTIVGDMMCPPGGIGGDINCSNCAITLNPHDIVMWDYWLLHITDTVDYSTLQVPERPMQKEEAEVEVYPNPTNNTVCVLLPNEAEATEMELINMNGQVVATKTFSGKGSWMEMGDLPKGMYMLRIRNAEVCLTRKVLRE